MGRSHWSFDMKQYKAVFIDWDDTIGDFIGAAKQALHEMYDKYHLSDYFASHEEFVALYKPHNIELWDKYGKDLVTKEYLSFDRFFYPLMHGSKVKGEKGKVKGENLCVLAEQLSEDFLNMTTAHFSLLEGAEELVRYLAKKYPLTVVTNGFVEVQYEKFDKSGLRDCFAHIVLSEEVGCQKPNPRIFEEALRMNGLQAEDVVMIGDSWSSDIQGAINAGIDQIWIKKSKEQGTKNQDTIVQTATYIVHNLSEVMGIL
ncbi:MAG: YjjG family noncanonical pyrimidine nucleotidase [Paludibacteraceae bacterium]|jgi:putative hydrolase of the HAD superfamily|nr:YjjG family noncanonical pyrimidine nucleotidase [Paludibacteraceae bacterium]